MLRPTEGDRLQVCEGDSWLNRISCCNKKKRMPPPQLQNSSQTTAGHCGLCKVLWEGEVAESPVCKCLAGQQEGRRVVLSRRHRLPGRADTLSNCKSLSLSLSPLGHWGSRCAYGRPCVCVWTYMFETVMHYAPAGFVPTSSVHNLNRVKYKQCHQKHRCSLPPYPLQSSPFLCWHIEVSCKDNAMLASMKKLATG